MGTRRQSLFGVPRLAAALVLVLLAMAGALPLAGPAVVEATANTLLLMCPSGVIYVSQAVQCTATVSGNTYVATDKVVWANTPGNTWDTLTGTFSGGSGSPTEAQDCTLPAGAGPKSCTINYTPLPGQSGTIVKFNGQFVGTGGNANFKGTLDVNVFNPLTLTCTSPVNVLAGQTCTSTGGSGGNVYAFATGGNLSGGTFTSLTYTAGPNGNVVDTVKVTDSAGGTVSTAITVNKLNQTITFGTLSAKTYGDPPFSVSATASSGLTVNFTVGVTDQCTSGGTNGSTITITGAGSCTVTAHQGGNGNYNPASDVPQTFSIGKATLTVAADNQTIQQGDPDPSPFTFGYSGFIAPDGAGDVDTAPTCGVSGAHSAGGSYTIACSGGVDNNYGFSYVNGTLTVEIPTAVTLTEFSANSDLGATPWLAAVPVLGLVVSGGWLARRRRKSQGQDR
ncbi:MAG: MBG domain-containing protein [Dehalococcoidia bacterium]|nr:MBG domain-containing protein [Dehalococcoidia bacterium]